MEAAAKLQYSSKQQMIRNGKGLTPTRRFISSRHQTENFVINTASEAELIHGGGMFLNHPHPIFSLSSPFTPPLSQLLHPHRHQHNHQPPPLLPLPVSRTFHSLPTLGGKSSAHSLSLSPTHRSKPKPKDRTPKKSSPHPKRQLNPVQKVKVNPNPNPNPNPGQKQELPEVAVSVPHLESMKKDVNLTRVLLGDSNVEVDEMEKFSGLVFSLSPPPSRLPLPKFSLRPKVVSCTVQAAGGGGGGVDDGATDNLCRLLNLR